MDIESWRIVEVETPSGLIVAAILDDGVQLLADVDLGSPLLSQGFGTL